MSTEKSPEKHDLQRQIIYSIGYFVITFLILSAINLWLFWPSRPQPAPYSQFLAAIDQQSVTKAIIGETSSVANPIL